MIKFREIKLSNGTITHVQRWLEGGHLTSGGAVGLVEEEMRKVTGCKHAVAVSSGTMALKIALRCMGIKRGDKVIVPDLTFVACAQVVLELGAKPIFADVDPETFVITQQTVKDILKKHPIGSIKAIMAVHLGGQLAYGLHEFNLPILYDAAHYMGSPLDGVTAFSFHPSKIISGIDGGCIVTNDFEIYCNAVMLRNFGFVAATRYMGNQLGYKGQMTNISASIIYDQLAQVNEILKRRAVIRDFYNIKLKLKNEGLGMYMVLVDEPDAVVSKLKFNEIEAIWHYPETMSCAILGKTKKNNAWRLSQHLISLPFHEHMSIEDVEKVCEIIKPHLIKL